MIPSFGSVFGEEIPAYFAMLTCAFLACTWFAVRWAKRVGHDHEVLIDLALYSVITGVAGARLAHVLFDGMFMDYVHLCTDYTQVGWEITRGQCESEWVQGNWDAAANVCRPAEQDCFAWLRFWQGGLTWYGGMVGGVGWAMYFLKKEGFSRLGALDLGGNVLPLGLFFGRMGCWFGGCCFGQPHDDTWWTVSFPGWSPASESQWRAHLLEEPSLPSLEVIPTQLLEAGGCLLIAFFVIGWMHPRKRFTGQVFLVSIFLYALLRFILEFFRADDRGGAFSLATSQWISLVLFGLIAAAWPRFQAFAASERVRLGGEGVTPKTGGGPKIDLFDHAEAKTTRARSESDVLTQIERILDANLAATNKELLAFASKIPAPPGCVFLVSPVWTPDGKGRAQRSFTIVPKGRAAYSDAAQDGALLKSPELRTLIANAARTIDLVHAEEVLEDISEMFEGDKDDAPRLGGSLKYEPGDRFVSLLLADAARLRAIGATLPEIRARYAGEETADLLLKMVEALQKDAREDSALFP